MRFLVFEFAVYARPGTDSAHAAAIALRASYAMSSTGVLGHLWYWRMACCYACASRRAVLRAYTSHFERAYESGTEIAYGTPSA
eukprot:3940984-Rhodomonas_salina.1